MTSSGRKRDRAPGSAPMRTEIEDYVPPHSLEAEMCALGAMLLSERACEEVHSLVTEDDFYHPAHREVFKAIRQLMLSRKAVDLVTLKNELTVRETLEMVGGIEYLIQIAESVPSASNALHYAQIVLDRSTQRRLSEAGHGIVQLVHHPEMTAEEMVDEAERRVFDVGRARLGKYFAPVKSLAKEFFLDVDALNESGQPILGVPTGFGDLDEMTGGFYPGNLTILGARPSMGKSSLMLSFALAAARKGQGNVAVFSLEMSSREIVRRLASMLGRVSMSVMRRSKLSYNDYDALANACETLFSMPIFVDDTSDLSPLEMRGKCRRLKADGGLSLVVVDYLQLMRSNRKTENRVQEISDIARSLKALSKDLDVPVIALSQLNRGVESRDNKRPMLSDIRESGSIEAEADVVMLLYRDEYYKAKEVHEMREFDPNRAEVAEVIIAKHRNGPTGTVLTAFQPNYALFSPLDDASKSEYIQRIRNV